MAVDEWRQLGTQERLHWAARETAKQLSSGGWDPLLYETRDNFRNSPPGLVVYNEHGEYAVTGLWCQWVGGTLERNRGRFQSLLQSAWVSTRDGLECADALWQFLADRWDWPVTAELPESMHHCARITLEMVRMPETLDVTGWRQAAKDEARKRR